MRIPITVRYEQTLSTFFTCLSVSLFMYLILLLFNLGLNFSSVIFSSVIAVSSVLVLRTLLSERKHEFFDISTSTLFESGLLIFQSPKNRCAVFFAFKLVAANFEKAFVHRTLTILLKILPASTTLAFEWTDQKACFITFYIKLEKSSFLTYTRELLDNIKKSFRAAFGAQHIKLLNGNELTNHFSMGIPGRFQKISVSGKYAINIQTDMINAKKAFAILTPENFDKFHTILSILEGTQNIRMILPIKKTEKATQIAKSLTIVFDNPANNISIQNQQPKALCISQIPASKSIQLFGDVLARNQIHEQKLELGFSTTATMIINLLLTPWHSPKKSDSKSKISKNPSSSLITPLNWRKMLAEQLSSLELSYEKDKELFIDKLPLRVDAQVDDLLFLIIPQANTTHVEWLFQKIFTFLREDKTKNVIFLLACPQTTILAQKLVSNFTQVDRIHLIKTKHELTTLLKEKKNSF